VGPDSIYFQLLNILGHWRTAFEHCIWWLSLSELSMHLSCLEVEFHGLDLLFYSL